MAEGLVIDLSVSQEKAEKQVDDFIKKQKAKLSKLEATVTVRTVHVGGGGGGGGGFRGGGGGGSQPQFRGLSGAYAAMGGAEARRREEREEEESIRRHNGRQEKQVNRFRESQRKLQEDLRRINEKARIDIARVEQKYGDESIRGAQRRADLERQAIEASADARRRAVLRNARIEKEAIEDTQRQLESLAQQESNAKARVNRREKERVEPLQREEKEQRRVKEERANDKAMADRLRKERDNAAAIHDIIESNQRKIDQIRNESLRKFAQRGPQNDVLMQRAYGFDDSVGEKALAAQRRINAVRLQDARETLAKIIQAEEAAGRRVQSFRVIDATKNRDAFAVPAGSPNTGTMAGSKAGARGISQLFQVQQSIEDFQYAGFRGLSNNVAFLASNLKNARLAAAGLFGVIGIGALDAMGMFDRLGESARMFRDDIVRTNDALIERNRLLEEAKTDFFSNPPSSPTEARDQLDRERRRMDSMTKFGAKGTMDNTTLLEAAKNVKATQDLYANLRMFTLGASSLIDNAAPDQALLQNVELLREAGFLIEQNTSAASSSFWLGTYEGIEEIIARLQTIEQGRTRELEKQSATVKVITDYYDKLLRQQERSDKRFVSPDAATPRDIIAGEDGGVFASKRNIDRRAADLESRHRIIVRKISDLEDLPGGLDRDKQLAAAKKEYQGIVDEAKRLRGENEKVNDQLEFAKELERARKDLKREQIDAEKEQLSNLKSQQRENQSLIEQERKRVEEIRKQSKDSRHGFESRQFDVGRGLTQRFTERQFQYAKAMDRANNPFLPPEVQEFRDKLHEQIFSQIAYARDMALTDARMGQLKGQAASAGKAGDFERQRKLLEELQGLQLDIASSDPSMARSAQMFQMAEKTQQAIERSFEMEARSRQEHIAKLENANRGLTNQMGSLEGAVRDLEAAIRGIPERAREQARREAGAGDEPAMAEIPAGGGGAGGGGRMPGGAAAAAVGGAVDPMGMLGEDTPAGPALPPRKARAKALQEAAAKRAEAAAQARNRLNDKIREAAEKGRAAVQKRIENGDFPAQVEVPGKEPFRYTKKTRSGYEAPGMHQSDGLDGRQRYWRDRERVLNRLNDRERKFYKSEDAQRDVFKEMQDQKYRKFLDGGVGNDRAIRELDEIKQRRKLRDRADMIRSKDPSVESIKNNTQKQAAAAEAADQKLRGIQQELSRLADGRFRQQPSTTINNFFGGGGGSLPDPSGFIPNIPTSGRVSPIIGLSGGARVPGVGFGDTVPAMLTPGEVVMNARQQAALGRMMGVHPSALFAAAGVPGFGASRRNSYAGVAGNFMPYTSPMRYAEGGVVHSVSTTNSKTNFGGVTINVKSVDEAGALMARMRTEQRAALIRRGAR